MWLTKNVRKNGSRPRGKELPDPSFAKIVGRTDGLAQREALTEQLRAASPPMCSNRWQPVR
jgi:hypothetical protein